MASQDKQKVYRLRTLPMHADRQSAAELLATCVDDLAPHQVRISSLASDVDPWARPPTKTATLTLHETRAASRFNSAPGEWAFPVPGLSKPLILDCHFRGLTLLNEVAVAEHQYDCIVLSGLGSHPFGSWQPHGQTKSFMWVRDELSQFLPSIRFILYGYDTTLNPSSSFQTVPDLGNSLIGLLKAHGWTSPTAKPLLFLAHSLGGVIVKQALVMLAGSGQKETYIASVIRGIIFFGVPSQGMNISDIFTMLGDQPNVDALVKDISARSDYLLHLEKQFAGISYLRTIKVYWGYETKTTRSIVSVGDTYSREGEDTVLVTKESATSGFCLTDPHCTIQIDENHSDMVKFTHGDYRIRVIASKLRDICGIKEIATQNFVEQESMFFQDQNTGLYSSRNRLREGPNSAAPSATKIPDPLFWDKDFILDSLRVDGLDDRVSQIESRSGHTFDWIYDKSSISLSQWLQRGRGIFWISGKPGSGKSTLMKFLLNDSRTSKLLHRWHAMSSARQITANFFFHYRGSVVQKSFEGLLRGIILQILEAEPSLFSIVCSALEEQYLERTRKENLEDLQSDLYHFCRGCQIQEDKRLDEEISAVIQSQETRSSARRAFRKLSSWYPNQYPAIEKDLLAYRDVIMQRQNDDLAQVIKGIWKEHFPHSAIDPDFEKALWEWRTSMDVECQVRQMLKHFGFENLSDDHSNFLTFSNMIYGRTRTVSKETIERNIKTLSLRHKARNEARIEVQAQEWTRARLEDILHRLCGQSLFDLGLCLLIGALDEYGGRTEFISGFLKDLTKEAYFPRTEIRILFSSRPWNVFREEFSSCEGLRIHEHTENDIRSFCMTSIFERAQLSQYLLPLVEEVVSRASGVFLWVKLVLRDLFAITAIESQRENVEKELRTKLDSIPDQLDDYYAAIVTRISESCRWDTYVALECLARTEHRLTAVELVGVIKHSFARRWPEAAQIEYTDAAPKEAEDFIRDISSGLVETQREFVQLMHQTVRDFIEDPQFRQVVLGKEQSQITKENGHTFLAKRMFLKLDKAFDSSFSFHARKSERTTGSSQYEFFSSFPPQYFNWRSSNLGKITPRESPFITSPLTLAVFAGLQLYLEDAYREDRHVIDNCSALLVQTIIYGIHYKLEHEDARKTIESFVEKGFNVERDLVGLEKITSRIWKDEVYDEGSFYVETARYLAEHIKRCGLISSPIPLHDAPRHIAELLLERGANPNTLDYSGKSPLDYAISHDSHHDPHPEYIHGLCELYSRYGGKLRYTTSSDWSDAVQHFEYNHLDCSRLRRVGWCWGPPAKSDSSSYGKGKKRAARGYSTEQDIIGRESKRYKRADTGYIFVHYIPH
ncbi:hypothetical protein F5Y06DRAFT_255526 [Hypoxylon sp. FL0890]|nr:hypothetical protein F5Y06DRAFT_255526 [Hypoxylon sp. FL0890]